MIDNNFADLDLADLKGMLRSRQGYCREGTASGGNGTPGGRSDGPRTRFTLADLYGGNIKPSRAAEQKYVNPDDATKTWSGRGRQPHWVRDALASGRALEELAI